MKILIFALCLYFGEPDSIRVVVPDTTIYLSNESGKLSIDTVIIYKEKYITVTQQKVFDKLDSILENLEKKK